MVVGWVFITAAGCSSCPTIVGVMTWHCELVGAHAIHHSYLQIFLFSNIDGALCFVYKILCLCVGNFVWIMQLQGLSFISVWVRTHLEHLIM